jgi:hypothetical protein
MWDQLAKNRVVNGTFLKFLIRRSVGSWTQKIMRAVLQSLSRFSVSKSVLACWPWSLQSSDAPPSARTTPTSPSIIRKDEFWIEHRFTWRVGVDTWTRHVYVHVHVYHVRDEVSLQPKPEGLSNLLLSRLMRVIGSRRIYNSTPRLMT